ncbi:CdaR family protein [Anaerotignum sp.]|uniref:CdaR family protein n=1 Tax=Anaerotignum sp. TaxID=2039241 RepID=UPI002714C01B|nr:CdaR family protein [Anaerotignum sp.]
MKKFQELLMKDLGWKLLSIGIAIIMWFMVININQPVDTRTYSKYITLENMNVLTNRGLTVENAGDLTATKVSIKVKAQRTALDRLNQSNDWLDVSVDLSGLTSVMDGDTVSLPVNVEMIGVYSGYTIVSKVPTTVEVHIEKIASKELPITISMEGELPADVLYSGPVLSAETVTVNGPASAVEQVATVSAGINAKDVADNIQLGAKLIAFDAKGVPVKGVSLGISEISVTYHALNLKTIPIKVNISGTPAEGYELGETTCTPQTVEVVGAAEALTDFVYLQLPDIDISGRSSDVSKSFPVADYLPEGVQVKNGNSSTILIDVQILGVNSREVTVDSDQLTVQKQEKGKDYQLSGSTNVNITGDEALINSIDESTLTGTVDVSGLTMGQHKVLIALDLPDDVTAGYAYIDVIVTEETAVSDNES